MRLLDGRRVQLADLMTAGLLSEGDRLVFRRPRLGELYEVVLSADGRLRSEGSEVAYSTPSAAAVALSGGPVDGWYAWRTESGRLLDDLRQELLEQAAQEGAEPLPPERAEEDLLVADRFASARHAFLRDARERAGKEDPVRLSVRDFIGKWGAVSRGYKTLQRIDADLSNHGLTTEPHYRQVRLDSIIALVLDAPSEDSPDDVIGPHSSGEIPLTEGALAEESAHSSAVPVDLDVGLTLGNLASAEAGVVAVSPDDPVDRAITTMMLHDFSQLPVMSGAHTVKGAVTWESIVRAQHRKNGTILLRDALIPARDFRYDTELTEALPEIAARGFVLVRGVDSKVSGIVTASDVVHEYGELAGPFLLLGELDQLLRSLIASYVDEDAALSICNRARPKSVDSIDQLTMGDYQAILGDADVWASLGWPLDQKVFCAQLDQLRELRNDVMHFNPDVDAVASVPIIRQMIRVVREYALEL